MMMGNARTGWRWVSPGNAVLVAPAHRVAFLQAAQAEEPAVYPFGGLPEHHVSSHPPHRRPKLEAVAAESCAEVEAAALRHLINERVPIWGDCVQGGEPACALALLHGGEPADQPFAGVGHEFEVDRFAIVVRIHD